MRASNRAGKWLTALLALVCLVLVINLVSRLRGTRVVASRPSASTISPARGDTDDRARPPADKEETLVDPMLRLDLLEELQARRLPEVARNPFEYGMEAVSASPAPEGVGPAAPPPAASLSVSLKALGYAEKAGGVREAYIADQEQLHVVREGDRFGDRFRVQKITPRAVEIEDELQNETIALPVPQ